MRTKKQRNTFIKLPAVIVMLLIISLMITPIVLSLAKSLHKDFTLRSAMNYIKAYNKYLVNEKLNDNLIEDGYYYIDENTNINYDGITPTSGIIKVERQKVTDAKLYINGYSIDKNDIYVESSSNDYSFSGNKKIIIKDGNSANIYSISKNKYSTENDINLDIDKLNYTYIICNNGVELSETLDGKIRVDNLIGNTTCILSNDLQSSIDNLYKNDKSLKNIMLLNDILLTSGIDLLSKNIILNLNGNKLDASSANTVYGLRVRGISNVQIKDTSQLGNGEIKGSLTAVQGNDSATIVINNGNYSSISQYAIAMLSSSSVTIYDGNFNGKGAFGMDSSSDSYIYGGHFTIQDDSLWNVIGIEQSSGNLTIAGDNVKILSNTKVSLGSKKGATGNLNLKDLELLGDKGTIVWQSTGDLTLENVAYNTLDENAVFILNYKSGTVNLISGNYSSMNALIVNLANGDVNVKNGSYTSKNSYAFVNKGIGNINICNGNINGKYDLSVSSSGSINYSNSVIFKNNTNIPSKLIQGRFDNINGSYTGTC